MQVKSNNGNINKGTIIVGVNTTESGCKDTKVIMDYYIQDKNKYQIYVYLQIKDSDSLRTLFDGTVDCYYSQLENWIKHYINVMMSNGSLRRVVREYRKSLEQIPKFQAFTIDQALLIDYSSNNFKIAVIWSEINKIFKYCQEQKIKRISLAGNIIMRKNGMCDAIEAVIMGNTVDVLTIIEWLCIEKLPYYKCEISYDIHYTLIKLIVTEGGKQFVVDVKINHNNRLIVRVVEQYIINKAVKVKYLTSDNDDYDYMYNMSYQDAIELDKKISLSTGKECSLYSDYVWQRMGDPTHYQFMI